MCQAALIALVVLGGILAAGACPAADALAPADRALAENRFQEATRLFGELAMRRDLPAVVRAAAFRGKAAAHDARSEDQQTIDALERAVVTDPDYPGNPGMLEMISEQVKLSGRPEDWPGRIDEMRRATAAHPDLQARLVFLDACDLGFQGRLEDVNGKLAELHPIDRFLVLGPFDNSGGGGFDEPYPPEIRIAPESSYADRHGRTIRWIANLPRPSGGLNLDLLIDNEPSAVAYALTHVRVGEARAAVVHLAGAGAVKLWLNGELVLAEEEERASGEDLYEAEVALREGWNRCLVKMSAEVGEMRFFLHFTDLEGTPLALEIQPSPPPGFTLFEPPAGTAPAPELPPQGLARFPAPERRIPPGAGASRGPAAASAYPPGESWLRRWKPVAEKASLADRDLIASYLYLHGFKDEALEVCRATTARYGSSVLPDVLRALALEAENSGESIAIMRGAGEKAPELVTGRLTVFWEYLRSGDSEGARREVEAALTVCPDSPFLLAMHGLVLTNKGEVARGRAEVRRARELAPKHTLILKLYRDLLWGLNEREEYRKELDAEIQLRPDVPSVASAAAALARLESRMPEALAYLEQARRARERQDVIYAGIGAVQEAAGDREAAIRAYEEGLRWAPNSKSLTGALGVTLLRAGRNDEALVHLRRHVQLEPTAFATREMIAKLEGRPLPGDLLPRTDFAELAKADLGWAGKDAIAVRLLEEIEIVRYPDGATESRLHTVTKVLTEAGVEAYRKDDVSDYLLDLGGIEIARTIKPDGRQVEAEKGVLGVAYGQLEPGDITELRFVVRGGPQPGLAEHFWGDYFLQFEIPCCLSRLSMLVPAEWRCNSVVHNLQLTPTASRHGEWRLDVWEAQRLPGIPSEPMMPPARERTAWIDLSTMSSWDEMVRWYHTVSRGRLRPTPAIRELAAELGEGAPGDSARIHRVAAYVRENIRYEGGEFAEGGLIPRPAGRVLRKKFGDCKDQAGLAISLLQEMGIPARFALVNSRDETTISYLPSPRFTHAVVQARTREGRTYWIDLTNRYLAFPNVPVELEEAQALLVDPVAPAFVTIGRDSAATNGSASRLQGTLSEVGDIDLTGSATFVGEVAAAYRAFLAEHRERKDEIITSLVQAKHPGADVSEPVVNVDASLDQPVRISYRLAKPASAAFAGEFMLLNIPWTLGMVPHSLVSLEQRRFPLVLDDWKGRYAERIELRVPAGRVPASETKLVELSCPQGRFRLTWKWSGDETIVGDKVLEIDAIRVSPQEYPEFRKFLMAAKRAEQEQVVLKMAR